MASYFLAFSFIIFSVYTFLPKKIISYIHQGYVILLLLLFSTITIAELEIYDEWGSKMNMKAIHFLKHPFEVVNSTTTLFLVMGLITISVLVFIGNFLYGKISPFSPLTASARTKGFKKFIFLFIFILVAPVLIALGIRGGTQQIPIQQSDVYFSKHNILNIAAVNSGWNLGQSILENIKHLEGNPYTYYTDDEAKKTVSTIYKIEKDTTIHFLKTNRPNIVLVILESWSADMIQSLGGYDGAAVNFDRLASEGIMFDSLYASGDLSHQGMAAIFSAFPAQPSAISIISQPSKYIKLPCLNTEFHKAGYTSSFLFGGQLSYGNIKAYMYYNDFDKILEGKDFDNDIPQGKLGVHDEFLYERQLKELKNEKQPFFAAMFTLSSHNPYDMPMPEKDKVKWGEDEVNYVNSVRYADQKLFEFVQNAKKEKWFDNTLFVFIADHSHRSPRHWIQEQPEYRKIPMLFWGNVIKNEFKGYRHKKICSQLDLASTLLNQLDISSERYTWSKNLFNPYTSQFAFYETFNGFGWIRSGQYVVYSHPNKSFLFEKTVSIEEKARLEQEGKSFMQTMFQQYTDY